MGDGNSLINLGELSKPASLLVEKISEGIGGLARPWQIKRVARAESEAEKIRAVAKAEVDELQRRALTRFVAEEMGKQANIESVTSKAIGDLSEDARPQDMENDWIANFFDRCKLISDEQMQTLWAKVLAGEANNPGSYSKRTVNLLASLDKSEAELFAKLCGFAWMIGQVQPLIFSDPPIPYYEEKGITLLRLCHLESIGLISYSPQGYVRGNLTKTLRMHYYGQPVVIEFPKDAHNRLELGTVLLTQEGRELVLICGSSPIEGFMEFMITRWINTGKAAYSQWPKEY